MGDDDLHSIAFSGHSSASPDSLGVLNAEMSSQFYMEMDSGVTSYTPPASAAYFHDYSYITKNNSSKFVHDCDDDDDDDFSSTGYLEDVLFEFSSKRRRLDLLFPNDKIRHYSENLQFHDSNKDFPTSDFIQDCCGKFDTLDQIITPDRISDMKTSEEAYDSSSSSYEKSTSTQRTPDDEERILYCTDTMLSSGVNEKIRKKKVTAKVVYPFDVVKPGGFEGDATLNDINERILMPPTRPVRHPVGDFACRPLVSPQGPGLSGKAVIAFTRVHTQGRGTVTIIRTRG